MVWCISNYSQQGNSGRFSGNVYDETQNILANCEYVLVSPQDYLAATQTNPNATNTGAFDYAASAQIFSFFFITTVAFYALSKNIGLILKAVKDF